MVRAVPAVRQQPVIIGGGPAGCAAAIRLAELGAAPLVLERSAGPNDKVCGDFLSADTLGLAMRLGVDPAGLGAVPIERVRLVHRGRVAETRLPFAAMGLSRRRFDAALLRRAVEVGAEVRTGMAVRQLVRDGAGWSVQAGGGFRVTSDSVFLATGKHDLRDWPRRGREDGAIGLKMYYQPAGDAARHLERTIELVLFPGGYAGLQPVEDGRVVLCLAVRPGALKAAGGWDGLLAALADSYPRLYGLVAGGESLLARPLAVAGVPYGYRARTGKDGLFRVGDQAAVIPSLTGDGMAIALYSGMSAAEGWANAVAAGTWQVAAAKSVSRQMWFAGLAHRAAFGRRSQTIVFVTGLFPSVLRAFARRTRLISGI